MIIKDDERKLFFKLWLKLLVFVNNEYEVIENFGKPDTPIGLNIDDIGKIRNKLWENYKIIDEYLKHSDLCKNEYEIVSSWKKFIKSKFMVLKNYKKYTVIMDFNSETLYGIYGITNPIVEIVPNLPMMIETVIIPFKDKIIYDSLIQRHNVILG
ncbi:MAG: hypothetical protein FWB99_08160, partial [Treponema sp.]|nr:hypothetical protein [Treponema sp.]